ncbi:MAG: hypothetical protein NC211_04760 [Alistipes senegalensis]|nr:hypothetical protein [Oxalobacter formigenes]MCM1281127.1 hypothetical protein [Alistipes senegalensis]
MKYQDPYGNIVEAIQWFKKGDHPEVIKLLITPEGTATEDSIIYAAWEDSIGGNLVTLVYAIETSEGLSPVTPGNYIITHANGENSCCPPNTFRQTFKPA